MSKRIIFAAIGGLFGVLIPLLISGDTNYLPAILGGVFGIGVVVLLFKLFHKPKDNKIPDRDERIDLMVRKFLSYVAIVTIGVMYLCVFTFDYLGFKSIDLIYLYEFLLILTFIVLVGITIIRKR
ncbi:hypothetical protein HF072_03705 [Bacillus sp. RO3]|nr:hypothetical protein [Bacillus sp. RO3]